MSVTMSLAKNSHVVKKTGGGWKKRVVVCCSDGASEVVISNKQELSDNFYLPSSKIDISQLMEKMYKMQLQ